MLDVVQLVKQALTNGAVAVKVVANIMFVMYPEHVEQTHLGNCYAGKEMELLACALRKAIAAKDFTVSFNGCGESFEKLMVVATEHAFSVGNYQKFHEAFRNLFADHSNWSALRREIFE